MKTVLILAFLLMGFTFTITQGVFIREFLVVVAGNELSIGLLLGNWLLLEAVGSGLLGRLADRTRRGIVPYAILQVAFSLCFPLSLAFTYMLRGLLAVTPGEGIGFLPILYSSFLILLPLGLIDGAMFTFGCRAYASQTAESASIGRVYIYEALGAILGGIVFTFLFIPHLTSLQIALVLIALNLASALSLLVIARTWLILVPFVLLVAALYILISPWAQLGHDWLARKQWEGYDLRYYRNSIYGNIAVTRREEQYTFYENGLPVLSVPVPDINQAEDLAHLPLLFHDKPRRVLVVSGGVGGVLAEILKHPVTHVDYAELDPLLTATVQQFPTPLTVGELNDPRVKIHHRDGRLVVKEKGWELRAHPEERYDFVLVNLPYPSTLQLNRLYTRQFFALAREIITDDGILAIGLPGSTAYLGAELRSLNATLDATLRAVFPQVRPIPGDFNLFLASPAGDLSKITPAIILQRAAARGIQATILTDTYLRFRLEARRLQWFRDQLRRDERTRVNEDLSPAGLFAGLAYWTALFSPWMSGYWAFLNRLSLPALALPLIGLALPILALRRRIAQRGQWQIPIAIAATGAAGMTFDLIIVFAFQAFYGYVYEQIGLLIPAFMGGLSLGGWLMTRRLAHPAGNRLLVLVDWGVLLYAAFLSAAILGLASIAAQPWAAILIQPSLLMLNVLGGLVVGLQFPLASHLYWTGRGVSKTAGLLYAADLLGAFVGALVVAAALLPALGIVETCLLLVTLKMVSLSLLMANG